MDDAKVGEIAIKIAFALCDKFDNSELSNVLSE